NFNYNSGGVYGFFISSPSWQLSAGVQKNILKGKGNLRLNISDIFLRNYDRASILFTNYYERFQASHDTRVANLIFTYRFGNNKVQAARKRSTASEEEAKRTN